ETERPMPDLSVLEQATELARAGEPFALATVVWRQPPSSGQQGSRAIITAAGELRGWIGGACAEPAVLREAREVNTSGVPRVRLPAGLDLGPATHQEIAVAILAELVRLRASGALAGPDAAGAAGQAAAAETAATDPVCGMTVAAGPSGRPLDHDGQVYYFCS